MRSRLACDALVESSAATLCLVTNPRVSKSPRPWTATYSYEATIPMQQKPRSLLLMWTPLPATFQLSPRSGYRKPFQVEQLAARVIDECGSLNDFVEGSLCHPISKMWL